jgi:hypothetical protein
MLRNLRLGKIARATLVVTTFLLISPSKTYSRAPIVVPPRLIELAQPDCSDGQPCHGLHGEVVVATEVRSDGTVGNTSPTGDNQILRDAAEQAARRCRFDPGTFEGKPKSMNYDLRFQF